MRNIGTSVPSAERYTSCSTTIEPGSKSAGTSRAATTSLAPVSASATYATGGRLNESTVYPTRSLPGSAAGETTGARSSRATSGPSGTSRSHRPACDQTESREVASTSVWTTMCERVTSKDWIGQSLSGTTVRHSSGDPGSATTIR